MKKIVTMLSVMAIFMSACSTHREVADQTFDSGWIRYQCGIYIPNFDKNPSKAVASILKEVDGVYYVCDVVKIGKYELSLERVSDGFFKVKDKDLYLELRGSLPNRKDYHGVIEVKPVKMQDPSNDKRHYNTTAEFFHLAPPQLFDSLTDYP